MKRILVGILALVMVLGLVGCGNSSKEIDEKLQGVWTVRGELYGRTYSFDNGNYESTLINPLGENNYSGTYKLVDEGIIMGSDKPELTYIYDKESGNLRLFFNEDELEKFY